MAEPVSERRLRGTLDKVTATCFPIDIDAAVPALAVFGGAARRLMHRTECGTHGTHFQFHLYGICLYIYKNMSMYQCSLCMHLCVYMYKRLPIRVDAFIYIYLYTYNMCMQGRASRFSYIYIDEQTHVPAGRSLTRRRFLPWDLKSTAPPWRPFWRTTAKTILRLTRLPPPCQTWARLRL